MDSKIIYAFALIIAALASFSEAATQASVTGTEDSTDSAMSVTVSAVTMALGLLAAVVRL